MIDLKMRGYKVFAALLTVFVFLPRRCALSSRDQDEASINKRQLLGNLWDFDEYCGLLRTNDEIIHDDSEIRSFYNGSKFESISANWHKALEDLEHINQIGLKARNTMPIICSATSWGYANEQAKLVADGPFVDKELCEKDVDRLIQFAASLYNYTNQTFDYHFDPLLWFQLSTFARLPPGPVYKNHVWMGDYESCLDVGSRLQASRSTNGTRFCYGLYGHTRSSVNVSGSYIRSSETSNGFRLGLCLPRSCSSNELAQPMKLLDKLDKLIKFNFENDFLFLTGLINNLPIKSNQNFEQGSYRLLDIYCLPDEDSELRKLIPKLTRDQYDKTMINLILLLALPLVWMIALAYSAIGIKNKPGVDDKQTVKDKLSLTLQCFDTRQNLMAFLRTNDPVRRLAGLNGIKVLTMNWLMMTHIYLLLMSHSSDLQAFRKRASLLSAFVTNGQHGVPVFFIISGLLVGHKLFRETQNGNERRESCLGMIVSRYLRLAPMYLLCYAYIKQFGHLIGSGPLWDYGVSLQSDARQCLNESWLVPVLMLGNFISPFIQCIITGWHIANDMQIYFLLPLLLYFYKRSRILGRILVGASFLFSHSTHILNWGQAQNYDLAHLTLEPFIFGSRYVIDRLAFDYVNPLGRIGTYFLGVLLADLLFVATENRSNVERYKESTIFLWGMFFWLNYLTILAPEVVKIHSSSEAHKPFIYPMVRISTEIGWFLLLYCLLRCKNGFEPNEGPKILSKVLLLLGHILRLPVWNMLVKMNYSIMLTHFTVAKWMVQSQVQLVQFTWMNFAQFFLLFLVIVYTVNFVIHLLIEVPLNRMIKLVRIT